jgi:hypothetical protein
LRRIRESQTEMTLETFKALVREQFNILLLDQQPALAAIPELMSGADAETRVASLNLIKEVLLARGEMSNEVSKRLGEISRLFGVETTAVEATPIRQVRKVS